MNNELAVRIIEASANSIENCSRMISTPTETDSLKLSRVREQLIRCLKHFEAPVAVHTAKQGRI